MPKPPDFYEIAKDITMPDTGIVPAFMPAEIASQLAKVPDLPQMIENPCTNDAQCDPRGVTPYIGSIGLKAGWPGSANYPTSLLAQAISPPEIVNKVTSASKLLLEIAQRRDEQRKNIGFRANQVWQQLASFQTQSQNKNLSEKK